MRSSIKRVFRHFLKTTTLHGFKYLCSPFMTDRVGWLVSCCASACCAGVLCTVLWARFMQVPALLSLVTAGGGGGGAGGTASAPLIALCPSPGRIARLFEKALPLPPHASVYLPNLFQQLIRNKPLAYDSLQFLERVLVANNLTLSEALALVAPPCGELVVKCRWRERAVECERLFEKHVTALGVCCIALPDVLNVKSRNAMTLNSRLDLMLNCSDDKFSNGCEFFTKYPGGEEWIVPTQLTTGHYYKAVVTFNEVLDSNMEKLVDGNCVSDPNYSRWRCFVQCKERACGCTDPLRYVPPEERGALPRCGLSAANCLRGFALVEPSCACRQSCRKILTNTVLETSPLDQIHNTFDPIFVGANRSSETMLSICVSNSGAKVFDLMYTETWWSLLSSLGGVFNMFLGVGLFSGLEVIIFTLHRLPLAIRPRRSEEVPTRTHTHVQAQAHHHKHATRHFNTVRPSPFTVK